MSASIEKYVSIPGEKTSVNLGSQLQTSQKRVKAAVIFALYELGMLTVMGVSISRFVIAVKNPHESDRSCKIWSGGLATLGSSLLALAGAGTFTGKNDLTVGGYLLGGIFLSPSLFKC